MNISLFRYFILVITLVPVLVSCHEDGASSEPVAEVGDAVLTKLELMTGIPVTAAKADSAVYADEFIRSWVHRQVLLQKAQQYLASETEDIEQAVEEYRSSLIIETYQNKLVEQKFKSNVTESDIEDYYNKMQGNFVLRDAIIKGVYAVLPSSDAGLKEFLKLLTKLDDESSIKVEEYLFNHSKQYKTFFDSWMPYVSVQKFFPLGTLPEFSRSLQTKPYIVVEQDGMTYLLKVTNGVPAGDKAPLDFVRTDISNILVNQRKLEFLSTTNRELYDQAIKSGLIKFYESND